MAGHEEENEWNNEWAEKAGEKLDQARDAKERVRKAMLDLEKKQAEKVEAIAAERRRQERLAAAAAARAKREQEERAAAEYKRQQAADLQAKQDALKNRKRGEAQALKQATADYHKARRDEQIASLKSKRLFNVGKSQSELQNAYILCTKQYRSWFVNVKACEMRLDAREKRPPSELFADNVQTSLERELATLSEARASLKALVDEGEKLSAEMSTTRGLVVSASSRENVTYRRQKLGETLQKETLQKSSSTPTLPAISGDKSPSGRSDFFNSMSNMFTHEHPSQEELLDRASTQTARATELAVECGQVLENCRNNVNKRMAMSNAALDVRKSEIGKLRKNLEQEKLEAEGTIRDITYRITMLKMKAQHIPTQTQEDEEEIQAAQALLKDLFEAKSLVEDDWRCKTSAFKIDEFCRNLTTIRAATMFKEDGIAAGVDESQNDSQTWQ